MNNLNKKNEFEHADEKKIDKNRRAVARAGAITPLMMTLISKTALGQSYHCTPSGMQSGNLSTHPDTIPCEAAGFTPVLEWHDNADKTSGNGCVDYWIEAGLIPFDIKINKKGKKKIRIYDVTLNTWKWRTNADVYDLIYDFAGANAKATTFAEVFGSDFGTLWENLTDSSIESDAATAYLNAKLNLAPNSLGIFNPVYENISPEDIVNFYILAIDGTSGFTTSSGTVIDSSFNAAYYLAGIILH